MPDIFRPQPEGYECGYLRGYADGYQGRLYEDYADRLSYSGEYDYGYSVGYEDGVYREPPEYYVAEVPEVLKEWKVKEWMLD